MLALVATEAETAQPGGETVITRLCDILVIQAIRSWIDNDPAAENGWLQALRDPLIGRALTLVHRDPSRHWTVTSLASDVGMSRSTLSAKFTDLIGVSPKQYITTWRMQIAESTLGDTDQSIAEIAASLGYQSEAAFSRAFKRETGIAPSHVRKQPDLMARAQEQVEG
jgi:AraC-like DNA-binding protein